MGCGASRPPSSPPLHASSPRGCARKNEALTFGTEDPGLMRFRTIGRSRSIGRVPKAEEKLLERSQTAPSKAVCKSQSVRGADRAAHCLPFHKSPSARADRIIINRPDKHRNSSKGSTEVDHFESAPPTGKEPETEQFLRKVVCSHQNSTLFGDLSMGHLNRLVRAMRRVDLEPNEMVITQGDIKADCCYICGEECSLEVLINGPEGPTHRRMLSPGEVFGELALLYNSPRSASVRAQEKTHVWKLERSAFQQTARDLAKEATDGRIAWLQSEFEFFADANLKSIRPLALAMKRVEVAAGACVPSHAGVVYLVETGSLQTKDEHMGPTRVVAILSSSEAADHLRAEEVVWRRQRQDFLQQSNEMSCAESVEEGSVAFREPVMEQSDQQKNAAAADTQSFTEVRREWDQAADLNEMSGGSQAPVEELSIEAEKVVSASDSSSLPRGGSEGASLLSMTVRQWSLLVTRMYRLAFDWEDLRHSLFSTMSPPGFHEFRRLFARQRSYKRGVTVAKEGTQPSEFYLLVDGVASVSYNGGRSHGEHRGFFFGCAHDQSMTVTVHTASKCVFAVCAVDSTTPQRLLDLFGKLSASAAAIITAASNGRAPIASMESLEHVLDIGSGGYGIVMLMRHTADNSPVAVKALLREVVVERQQCDHVMSERQLLTELRHPFLVELLATFKDSKRLFMAMEYLKGGELWSLLATKGTLSAELTRFIIGSLTLATQHMHMRHFVYRDMKPENLMIHSDGYVKLIDFGFCKKLHDGERTFTACGTVEYMAPELIKLKGHSFEVDWWSIGVLLYECLHGYTPFSEEGSIEDDWHVIRNIVNASYPLRYGHLLSDEAIQLMKEMLTHDPAERIDAQGMQKHPFFSGLDWDALLNKSLVPPYVPPASEPFDTSNFEPEIDENLTGTIIFAMEVEPYPQNGDEWDINF